MIQALNTSNTNSYKAQTPNFGQNNNQGPQKRERHSKTAATVGYLGTQFIAGAVVQSIIDGLTNAYRAIRKTQPTIPLKEIAQRAAFTGSIFAVIGLVFTGIHALMTKHHK